VPAAGAGSLGTRSPREETTKLVRVLITSGFRLMAESVAAKLVGVNGMAVSPCCGDFGEVARAILRRPPDLLLLDVYHDRNAALDLAVELRLKLPGLKILILGIGNTRDAVRCVEAACSGFTLVDCSLDELHDAIARVLRGEEVYPDPSRMDPTAPR